MILRAFFLFLVASLATCDALQDDDIVDNFLSFTQDYNEYYKSGKMSVRLQETMDLIRLQTPWKGANPKFDPLFLQLISPEQKAPITCLLCDTLVNQVLGWIEAGETREQLVERAVTICLDLNIQKENVCRGLIESNIDILLFIYANREVRAVDVCGMALFPDCPLDNPMFNWTVDISIAGPKPPVTTPILPPEGSPTFKVLHISDLHLDLHYAPGSNAECDEPTCCRADQGAPANESAAAGYWGDYRDCDMPWHSFVNMLEHIRDTHPDISYVVFTGDVPDHVVWNTSFEYNTELFTSAFREMSRVFSVPVFPILGNHGPHPLNQFAGQDLSIPRNVSSSWLYELMRDSWSQWLRPETHNDILSGGFYMTQAIDNLWIIGINNNFCYNYNFWNLYDNEDPGDQLKWLVNTLTLLESQGRKVHILAHIPPGGGSCVNSWGKEFNKIVHRFESTITAHFVGHSHSDQFYVYYDPEDLSRPNGVAFLSGSMTPYSDLNPQYRIYTIEGTYAGTEYRVLDHENWYYNLTEANLNGPAVPPNWRKLYNFNEEFGTVAQIPSELDQLIHRMINDTSLIEKYNRFHVSMADPGLAGGCDVGCQRGLVCRMVETLEGDLRKCEELWPPQ
ncbi:sphingomyelin phosphodiesterase-like [Neocloeon triangulifer]|uniref:sphingomyelin phosphodiesterase-like n=1 Tax=Neocloeon triangulifer TaxID=2078957 RepID=UPI00286F035F|nr:sphingomyelin phosphodiesterase-like [Neocloeon triangulifer]